VAGLALKAFGNIPAEGDVTTYHGLELKVLQVKGHRVRRVQVRVLPPSETDGASSGDTKTSTRKKTQRLKTDQVTPEA
jgi:Mg2+/Co2+ transporter CorC